MKDKALKIITISATGIICLYYFVYLLLCLIGFDARAMALFALFVMAVCALPIIFAGKLERLLRRAYKPLWIAFTVILCLYILSVIFFWCYIGFHSAKTPQMYAEAYASGDEDIAVMVFGCRTYGYTPSRALRFRLDKAYELLTLLPDSVCIVSGGQGTNETVAEAEAMRAYLVGKGIAEERIIMESASHSTSENIRLTKALLEAEGLEFDRIIGVSTAFHLPRIEMLSGRHGLPMELCAAPSPGPGHHYVSMIREYLSYIKMLFFDEAVIITKVT